jgi:hypothetical protein
MIDIYMYSPKEEQNSIAKKIAGAILSLFGTFCVFFGSGGILLDITGNARSLSGFVNDLFFIGMAAAFLAVGTNFIFGPGERKMKALSIGTASVIAFLMMMIYFGPFAMNSL